MASRNSLVVFRHLASTLSIINRTLSIISRINLGAQMKQLNDNKQFKQALSLFDTHKQSALTNMVIDQALKACINLGDFERGRAIHKELSPDSVNSRYVQVSLIRLYMLSNDVNSAQRIFASISEKHRTLFLYSVMLNGLVSNNQPEEAFNVFEQMTIKPDSFILTILFKICGQFGNDRGLKIGQMILAQMHDNYKNIVVLTSALSMFLKCGDVTNGEKLFAKIKSKDIVIYNTMMKGYNINNDPLKTLALRKQINENNIKPSEVTFILLAQACSQIGMMSCCRDIVAQIPNQFLVNKHLQTALIDMWGKAGSIENAQRIWETIKNPDTICLNTMINSFGLNGLGSSAIDLYNRMPADKRSEVTYICVLNACSHSGYVEQAFSIFGTISSKTTEITVAMIDCLSRMNLLDEAQKLVDDFEQFHDPNPAMYMAMLSGARNHRNIIWSQKLFDKMTTHFPDLQDRFVSSSILLANTYSSIGERSRSSDIKKMIRESGIKVKIGLSWTLVDGELVEFRAHDRSHSRISEIDVQIVRLAKIIVEYGYKYDVSCITRPVQSYETVESVLWGHSEKIALAYNFIQKSIPSPIQITKNLRICLDCHQVTKLIAKIFQLHILIRDANRVHHFSPTGQCSCRDHF